MIPSLFVYYARMWWGSSPRARMGFAPPMDSTNAKWRMFWVLATCVEDIFAFLKASVAHDRGFRKLGHSFILKYHFYFPAPTNQLAGALSDLPAKPWSQVSSLAPAPSRYKHAIALHFYRAEDSSALPLVVDLRRILHGQL